MKKATFFGLLLGGWLLGGGCSNDDKSLEKFVSDEVEITDLEILLPSSGKTTESTIITSDHPWSIEGGSDWCTISPRNGEPGTTTIYFTLLPNEGYDDRSVIVTLHTSDGDKPLTIYQKKKDAIIFAKDRFDNVPMEGANIEVALQANVEYRIEIPSANNWITATGPRVMTYGLTSSVETFRVAATQNFAGRSGIIVFINTENEKMRDTVTVYQVQRDQIILTNNTVRVPLDGETIRVPVRSNIDYEVNIPASITWIHEAVSNRADEIVLVIDEATDGLDRTGVITIRDKNNHALSATLTIEQQEKETLKFEDDAADVPRTESRIKLVVQENLGGKYKIVIPEYAPWITLDETPASLDSHDIWIVIEENGIDELAREGRVFVQGTENTDLLDMFVVRQAGGRVPESDERITLLAIASVLDFGTWQNNWQTTWQLENPLNKWEGLTTDPTGQHVVALSFSTNANGQLPKEIGDLLYLETLTFSANIGGALPPQIANLKNLSSLSLTSGKFEGIIPEFGALTGLKKLIINNGFTGQPGAHMDAIGWLENLEELEVRNGNYGTAMPATWGNLKKLQKLYLNNNVGLTNVDPIGGMTALRTLDLYYLSDWTSGLPESLGNLTELNSIVLTDAALSSLPQSLGNLSKLNTFNITGTNITELPSSIENLKGLRSLTLSNNKLTALPEALSGMTNLTRLEISGNPDLAGELPQNIGNLSQVTTLMIINNPKLTGKIPESISKLQRITTLDMRGNAFTELPESIGEMVNLVTISLENNNFQEGIPESIGNLKKVEYLYIFNNTKIPYKGLTGTIPASIGGMESLKRIYLQNNQLSGDIPTTLSSLTNLLQLYLNDNELTGTLPGSLSTLPGLSEILLQNNGLSGSLPVEFQDFADIQILDLYNNNFEGRIPDGFQGKAQCYTRSSSSFNCNIGMNKLSGTIPAGFLQRATANPSRFNFRQQKPGFELTDE
ncbi:MAG: leucine-rich repeat domain-containing protein [Odoribacteraceae bacterium]|nr:leucine-rich repeat domain-containing protein [Odoribacteraceae bacterium]